MDMRALVGRNFARIRREKGLTQEQVEARSGFSQQYLSGLERGKRNPTVITLYELAPGLGRQPCGAGRGRMSRSTRCLIPRFDGAILSLEWKEAAWDKFVMGAPRPRTPSEQQYSDRKLRSRR